MKAFKTLNAAADQPLTWLALGFLALPLSGHTDAPLVFVAIAMMLRKFKDMEAATKADSDGDVGA